MLPRNYNGMIFDFNGTLFHDSDKHEAAWHLISGRLRSRPLSGEEFRSVVHGRTTKSIIEYLAGGPVDEEILTKLIEEKERLYRELCLQDRAKLRLVDGAVSLFDFLRLRKIPMTIATMSIRSNVDFYIETFNLEKWFDLDLIVYDDGSMPGKPAPDIYLKAAEKIGVEPKNCVVVEDAESGIASAVRAGVGKVIAVGAQSEHERLKGIPGVDEVIKDFTEFDRGFFS